MARQAVSERASLLVIGKGRRGPKSAEEAEFDEHFGTHGIEMKGAKGVRQSVSLRERKMSVNRKDKRSVPSVAGIVYVAPYTKMVNGKVVRVAGYHYQRKAKS